MVMGRRSGAVHHRKRAIRALVRGCELALQLQARLAHNHIHKDEDVVAQILGSFTHTISILNQIPTLTVSDHDPRRATASCSDPEYHSTCIFTGPPTSSSTSKDRCYNTRKRNSETMTWTNETTTWMDDGHSWRKYGQKVILNAKYPRNYFRCTHKYDQNCQATKQVQRIQHHPPLFRTTYHGSHTCKTDLLILPINPPCAPPHEFPSCNMNHPSTATDSSILLSFQPNKDSRDHDYNYPSLLIKNIPSNPTHYDFSQNSSSVPRSYNSFAVAQAQNPIFHQETTSGAEGGDSMNIFLSGAISSTSTNAASIVHTKFNDDRVDNFNDDDCFQFEF